MSDSKLLSFLDFVKEEFIDGIETPDGYAEIFKNPSIAEIQKIGKRGKTFNPDGARGPVFFQVAAFVTDQNWYVWHRDNAEHHDVKSWFSTDSNEEATVMVPLYVDFYPQVKLLDVRLADWSLGRGDTARFTGPFIRDLMMKVPGIRQYSNVECAGKEAFG